MNVRLDYSDTVGIFRILLPYAKEKPVENYKMLDCLPDETAQNFVCLMLKRYPQLLCSNGNPYPDYASMLMELQHYTEKDCAATRSQLVLSQDRINQFRLRR